MREKSGAKRVAGDDAPSAAAPAIACESAAVQVSGGATPTLRGVALLSGTPVNVYVFRTGADDIVVVLRADCRLVTKQTQPAPAG